MALENPPFEDVFPIQDGDFPLLCLFTGGLLFWIYPPPSNSGFFFVFRLNAEIQHWYPVTVENAGL